MSSIHFMRYVSRIKALHRKRHRSTV